jgi:hypothetical protein
MVSGKYPDQIDFLYPKPESLERCLSRLSAAQKPPLQLRRFSTLGAGRRPSFLKGEEIYITGSFNADGYDEDAVRLCSESQPTVFLGVRPD